jgi:hypothetical protein
MIQAHIILCESLAEFNELPYMVAIKADVVAYKHSHDMVVVVKSRQSSSGATMTRDEYLAMLAANYL